MTQRYARIFAALDGASTQEVVARRALALASDNNAQLLFGHVVDVVPSDAQGIDYEELRLDALARLQEDLSDILHEAQANSALLSCELEVHIGRIGDTLIEQFIKPYDPDLVICGERGLSNIKYTFVGSVSRHLIRTVRCDVLVVKQG